MTHAELDRASEDLEMVRWNIRRLAGARLLGPLSAASQAEYDRQAQRERVLLRRTRASEGLLAVTLRQPVLTDR